MANELNQCDGCRRGLPVDAHGVHRAPGEWDSICCTADKYRPEPPEQDARRSAPYKDSLYRALQDLDEATGYAMAAALDSEDALKKAVEHIRESVAAPLRAALKKFGSHRGTCMAGATPTVGFDKDGQRFDAPQGRCTCGLWEAVDGL